MPHTFGNQGGLFLQAMVWWDHETESFWSQPTGLGIVGDYVGVRLEGVPVSVETWSAWVSEHPDTVVLADPDGLPAPRAAADPFAPPRVGEVAGVTLGDDSKAWYVDAVGEVVALNDMLGEKPVLVYANPDEGSVHIFLRETAEGTLEFKWVDGRLVDTATGSVWNGGLGIAIEGALAGEALRVLPHSSAFDWACALHHPRTEFYPPLAQ